MTTTQADTRAQEPDDDDDDDYVEPPEQTAMHMRIATVGSVWRFSIQAWKQVPEAVTKYPSEVFRQIGILIRDAAPVVLFLLAALGLVLGLTAHYIFESIGISSYIGAVNAVASVRGVAQVIFGWIVAAKVGCGIVAEIGAMRISEEIDALEVMGIRPIAYLVSTRLVAGVVVMPFLFSSGLLLNFYCGQIMNVNLMHTASSGAFHTYLYLFQNMRDFSVAIIWGTIVGVMILVIACFYGYTASGGPVGVGMNTAQSMLVNLVLISGVAMVIVQIVYGNDPNAPIGN